jgi:hypothetical protein
VIRNSNSYLSPKQLYTLSLQTIDLYRLMLNPYRDYYRDNYVYFSLLKSHSEV